MHVRVLVAVAVIAASMSIAGCSRLTESLEPEPIVVTEEATAAVAAAPVEGTLAEKTPRDLPLWPQATVVFSDYSAGTYTLSLSTGDTYEDVLNGVAAGFERATWEVAVEDASEEVGPRSAVLTVGSDKFDGLVTVSETESATVEIEYILTPAGS